MNDKPTLEEKKAYYDSVKGSNYQASLRLEGFDVEDTEEPQSEITENEGELN